MCSRRTIGTSHPMIVAYSMFKLRYKKFKDWIVVVKPKMNHLISYTIKKEFENECIVD